MIPAATTRRRAAITSCPGAPTPASNFPIARSRRFCAGDWSATARPCSPGRARASSFVQPSLKRLPDGDIRKSDRPKANLGRSDGARGHRRSFSPRFLEGRAWLRRRFEEAGLAVRLDAGGNLIGRLEGSLAAEPILLGSHSDTVPSGGRFDGPAGIIAALEVVRGFRDQGYQARHPLEVVDFPSA